MKSHRNGFVAWLLAAAIAGGQAGCAAPQIVQNPTLEDVLNHVQAGDRVDLVLKSGDRRTVQVVLVKEDGFQVDYAGDDIPYAAIARMQVRNDGTTHEGRQATAAARVAGAVVGVAVVIVAAPVLLFCGLCGLAASSRHW